MAPGICLISVGNPASEHLADRLKACGLSVWTPASPGAGEGEIYQNSVCIIIDLPQNAAVGLIRLFRQYGIRTPALLLVSPGYDGRPDMLDCTGIMDILPRHTSPLRILRWVLSVCAAKHMLARASGRGDRLCA